MVATPPRWVRLYRALLLRRVPVLAMRPYLLLRLLGTGGTGTGDSSEGVVATDYWWQSCWCDFSIIVIYLSLWPETISYMYIY